MKQLIVKRQRKVGGGTRLVNVIVYDGGGR
jgi:hypothetical protein